MKFALKDIASNPFRQLSKYPVVPTKVEKLKKSIKQTGFWDNIVARIGKDGKPELSHGHNRKAALLDLYGPKHEIDLIIREFSDAKMIQSMAAENDEDFGHNLSVFFESVKAAVQALGEGKISAEEMPLELHDKTNVQHIRYAPSYVPGKPSSLSSSEHPYTASSLGNFLSSLEPDGEASDRILAVLNALELIERGIVKENQIEGQAVKALLKFTRDLKAEHVIRAERLAKAQLDAKAFQERQSKLDAQRREQEAKDAAIERKRLQELAEARLEKDKEQIKALEAQRKQHREQAEARALVFKENRAKIDEKIDAANERAEAFKPKPEETLRAQTVSAMVFKFSTIYSASSGIVKEAETLGRNQRLTPSERELLRQAMLKAGERLRYGSENFLPPGTSRMGTKVLRVKAATENAEKFFKKSNTKSKGEK